MYLIQVLLAGRSVWTCRNTYGSRVCFIGPLFGQMTLSYLVKRSRIQVGLRCADQDQQSGCRNPAHHQELTFLFPPWLVPSQSFCCYAAHYFTSLSDTKTCLKLKPWWSTFTPQITVVFSSSYRNVPGYLSFLDQSHPLASLMNESSVFVFGRHNLFTEKFSSKDVTVTIKLTLHGSV